LHENASLDSALESGLQNVLLDGNLKIRNERVEGEELSEYCKRIEARKLGNSRRNTS
jgi:hypothetical protein